jgi:4,4'-diaponeurosporenoate glycosyltransferase
MLVPMSVRVALVLVGWMSGWWLLWRAPRLRPAGAADLVELGDCSVIVPARDEREALPSLLGDLQGQTTHPRQVIVVDDRSSDGTAEVAASFAGVTVVVGEPPPAGWAGKPWACAQGVDRAMAKTLVFLDADVRLEPEALAAVVAAQRRAGGLFSVLPHHDVRRPYERLSALFNLVSLMGVGMGSPGRSRRASGAFGPCMACRRDDYDGVGGHAAVRSDIVDDLALARSFSSSGLPVTAAIGDRLVGFRMYPKGARQLVEGWSKNMARGARSVPAGRAVGIGVWITAMLSSILLLVDAALDRTPQVAAAAGVAYGAFVVQQRAQLRQLGRFGWGTALAYPLHAVFLLVVVVRSAWLTFVRRRVSWKGRSVAITSDPTARQG